MSHRIRCACVVLTTAIVFCCGVVAVHGQTSLTLTDQLPPYLMSAVLLNNGHFAVSTSYTGTPKSIIYREDGTGNRPVNYTSHIHLRVDDVLFQLPFESNIVTDAPPPPNPLRILRMFRDTVERRPRINADMVGIMPGSGDSIRVVFTMEPVKRPSGGFIRMSVAVENRGSTQHTVGVLMLIDTKIDNNDRAPIATAYGFNGVETSYERSRAPGMPEFWLALEGTPIAPGLAARGNLRASDLVEPDVFLYGNWVDDPPNNLPGLYRVQWKERVASGLDYTDSAILLIWDQNPLGSGRVRTVASTEIGVVDSLIVRNGIGNGGSAGGGGGSLGIAGASSCLTIEAIKEDPCGLPGYKPYDPDTLQALYLVTNTGAMDLSNVRLEVGAVPLGLRVVTAPSTVIPSTILSGGTGVAVLSIVATPRLATTTYQIPVAFVRGVDDTVVRQNVCVTVPGLLAEVTVSDVTTPFICPSTLDTISIPIDLKGFRCRKVDSVIVLTAGGLVRPLPPYPILPADGRGVLRCEIAPVAQGTFPVRVRIVVLDEESLVLGDTTWVSIVDTITVTVNGKLAELRAVLPADTLDLGSICITDVRNDDILVQNVGGCAADVTRATFVDDAGGVFAIDTALRLPLTIARGQRGSVLIQGTGIRAGVHVGTLEVTTAALPGTFRIPVRLTVDVPAYELLADTIDLDTICPGEDLANAVSLRNPTACEVIIDTIEVLGPDSLEFRSTNGFSISANGRVSIALTAYPVTSGPFLARFNIRSSVAGDRTVVIRGTAATRMLNSPSVVSIGDVRVGTLQATTTTVVNNGEAPVIIRSMTLSGPNSAEFTLQPRVALPATLRAGDAIDVDITTQPFGIEQRRAFVSIVTDKPLCAAIQPILVTARGIQPLLDIVSRQVIAGQRCVGSEFDTVLSIRNVGNAPLLIRDLQWSTTWITAPTSAFPIQLDSGAAMQIPIRIVVPSIGPISTSGIISMDGDWLTPTDTTIQLSSAGLLCGVLSADTTYADVGTTASITIRLSSDGRSTLTNQELLDRINDVGAPISLGLRADASLVRLTQQVSGSLVGATVGIVGNDIRLDHSGSVITGQAFAVIPADVLLGQESRTSIDISILDFVNGYYDLRIQPGLLIASYCAKDQRLVRASPNGLVAWTEGRSVVLASNSAQSAVSYTLELYSMLGGVQHIGQGTLEPHGIHRATIIAPTSGLYVLRITTGSNATTLPMLIVE